MQAHAEVQAWPPQHALATSVAQRSHERGGRLGVLSGVLRVQPLVAGRDEQPDATRQTDLHRQPDGDQHALPVLAAAQRDKSLQVMLSTHAPELLDDEGVLPREVLVLRVTGDGTTARLLSDIDEVADEIDSGLPTSEIVDGQISPQDLSGLINVGAGRR